MVRTHSKACEDALGRSARGRVQRLRGGGNFGEKTRRPGRAREARALADVELLPHDEHRVEDNQEEGPPEIGVLW